MTTINKDVTTEIKTAEDHGNRTQPNLKRQHYKTTANKTQLNLRNRAQAVKKHKKDDSISPEEFSNPNSIREDEELQYQEVLARECDSAHKI